MLGPDSGPLAPSDVRRLFRGQRLTAVRRSRLAQGARILALCGNRVMGAAAYDRGDGELRVYEFGLDPSSACGTDQIADGLLDALELACMAAGGRRLLLLPRAAEAVTHLRRRGYHAIAEGAAGTWIEKTFL